MRRVGDVYSAERPRIGARVVRCMGCDMRHLDARVVEVTDVPVTEIRRRDSVVRYYGVRFSTQRDANPAVAGSWISAADCVFACEGAELSANEIHAGGAR